MPGHRDADVSRLDETSERPRASRTVAVTIVALGIGFDISFNGQRPGLSIPLFVAAVAVAVRVAGERSRARDAILAAAVLFSLFPAIRANPTLVAVDLVAVAILLMIASGAGDHAAATVPSLVLRVAVVAATAPGVPRFVAAPAAGSVGTLRRAGRWLRPVALTAVVVGSFAVLLASADRVFGELLTPQLPRWNAANTATHVALIGVGTLLAGTLVRAALARSDEADDARGGARARPLGAAEWTAVLGGIDLLFAAFVVVQFAFLFGGRDRVEVTPGLTYAEYARSGFFQLLAVAGLTVLVILAAWDLGRRDAEREERRFKGLVATMVALSFVILASAVARLALYEQTFGFTLRRLTAYLAIAWIALVFLILLATIRAGRRRSFGVLAAAAALIVLLVANVMNPDRFVATRNAERFAVSGRIDVGYLGAGLGPDAVPVAAGLLPALDRERARVLREALCARARDLREPGWQSLNAGRARARAALEAAGISEPCPAG